MESLLRNVRLGLRSLRRTPSFALTAVLTLALGIGLSTAVYTVANALLVRRLPVREQDRIVVLWGESRERGFAHVPIAFADAREFARRSRSLEWAAFAGYEGAWAVPLRDGGRTTQLRRAVVSGEFFETLGARPDLGRALRAADDVVGAARVVVLSHAGWMRGFGGDPSVVGRRIVPLESDVAYTIVGVMPRGLDYPRGVDFWAPVVPARTKPGTDSTFADVDVIARLRSGVTAANARDELTAFFRRPGTGRWESTEYGVAHTLPRLVLGDTRPALLAFAAAAALLLLITCINVANLLLVRGLARVRDVAVRSALGAGRGRIVAQLLTESGLLAIAGGTFGVATAMLAVRSFVAFAPADFPRLDEVHADSTALTGAVAITALAMLAFAVAPALTTSRVDVQQVLRSDTRQSPGRRSRLTSEGLVVGQVALAIIVLSAAGLIARSLVALESAKLELEPTRLLIAELAVRYDRFDDVAKQRALLERLLPAIAAVPGVRAASPVVAPPFSGTGGWDGALEAEGQSREEAKANPVLNLEVVVPSYFQTLGMPVLRGRGFTEADREGAPRVIVISQSAARHYWPGQDPIGKRLKMGTEPPMTVVGIVPDTRYRDLRDARPSVYFPLRQSLFPFAPMTLAIRTSGPPAQMVPAIRRAIGEVDPGVALASATSFETALEGPLAQPRLNAFLLTGFAGAALVLASVGLFGVMATMVRQRTRELGVRMALGATAADVGGLVLRRGMALAAAGTSLGLLGALAANRLLTAMLYGVSPTDAATLGAVVALLLGVAAVASLVPARSSTRIDPMIALRAE